MAKVMFLAKGKRVSFSTKPSRKKKLTPYQKFMKKNIKKYVEQGKSPTLAMKKAASDWNC